MEMQKLVWWEEKEDDASRLGPRTTSSMSKGVSGPLCGVSVMIPTPAAAVDAGAARAMTAENLCCQRLELVLHMATMLTTLKCITAQENPCVMKSREMVIGAQPWRVSKENEGH